MSEVGEVKKPEKKIKFKKKVFYHVLAHEINEIWKALSQIYKRFDNTTGDIKSKLSLKEIDNGLWNVIITVDEKEHINLKGHLNLVLIMIEHFRKIYDWKK